MLRNTFVHVEGIGEKTEQALWRAGVRTWDDFRPDRARGICRDGVRLRAERVLEESRDALARGDAGWFSERLPNAEAWRMFSEFGSEVAYLDIETTGVSPGDHAVTVVGVWDGAGGRYDAFVAGRNLRDFPDAIRRYPLLVTFNGARFDLPFLRIAFPGIDLPRAHIDLRYLFARLRITGGLKRIEHTLGIERPEGVAGIEGWQAIVLWARHLDGDDDALDLLLRYNREDVANLPALLAFGIERMRARHARLLEGNPPG